MTAADRQAPFACNVAVDLNGEASPDSLPSSR
jgi:hypothetical protein